MKQPAGKAPGIDPDRLRDFRSRLRVLEREAQKGVSAETECCGLTLGQCHLLTELGSGGELSVNELARAMRLDKSTLSRGVEGLVALGLLSRRTDPEDRRCVRVGLTSRGREAADRIDRLCNCFYEGLFEHIPRERWPGVIESVGLLAEAFEKSRRGGGEEHGR